MPLSSLLQSICLFFFIRRIEITFNAKLFARIPAGDCHTRHMAICTIIILPSRSPSMKKQNLADSNPWQSSGSADMMRRTREKDTQVPLRILLRCQTTMTFVCITYACYSTTSSQCLGECYMTAQSVFCEYVSFDRSHNRNFFA